MDLLDSLRGSGSLAPLDVHFARTVARIGGESDGDVVLAAALASRQVRLGHVCLDLEALSAAPRVTDAEGHARELALPPFERWRDTLAASALVGDATAATPLVLDGGRRLYLRRYFEHERELAAALRARAEPISDAACDVAWLRAALDRLFPADRGGIDWQRAAAMVALDSRLTVISGGPGTGKTFTVVKLLVLLIEQCLARGQRPPRIALAAPTGKASARLVESIRAAKQGLACEEPVKAAIPDEAATIHRLLGTIEGSSTRFVHNRNRPLAADVVLIDEASMVDLALMRRLLDAVPAAARLILLGDKDQLASVEAGAVLGDICNSGGARRSYSRAFAARWQQRTGTPLPVASDAPAEGGIRDCIIELERSYRYAGDSGIGRLARAINAGDAEAALALLSDGSVTGLGHIEPESDGSPPAVWLRQMAQRFEAMFREAEPLSRLRALGACRLLCAHRRGRSGVKEINQRIEQELQAAGRIDLSSQYSGRPIIVTRNDYQVQLFNGDTGLLLAAEDGTIAAYFEGAAGEVRRLAPARLPQHDTVYAMSVHKSQGSELDMVGVVLPGELSPVVSRELLYTAVTRAKHEVVLCGSAEIVAAAIGRPIERSSGLREALWR
ncbi:MAG TPA: exodeoxyribonuclease V subunit alpha [Terriglobales bacterium]|nr:exodeoxyribonuclease V subunit alpha [Terriglobales bacterium]